MDVLLYEEAGGGDANLAGIEEHAHAGAHGGGIEVLAVVEDDVGRLAAAFEAYVLHVAVGGVFQEVFADFGRAGEGDHIDIHMEAERLTGLFAEARYDIEDAVGDACFRCDLGKAERGKRRLLGRLHDDGIACGERRAEFPGAHEEREVPRHHGGDDTQRFARDHADRIAARRRDLVIDLVDGLGIPLHGGDDAVDIHALRKGDRLAHVERFEERQFLAMVGNGGGETQ